MIHEYYYLWSIHGHLCDSMEADALRKIRLFSC